MCAGETEEVYFYIRPDRGLMPRPGKKLLSSQSASCGEAALSFQCCQVENMKTQRSAYLPTVSADVARNEPTKGGPCPIGPFYGPAAARSPHTPNNTHRQQHWLAKQKGQWLYWRNVDVQALQRTEQRKECFSYKTQSIFMAIFRGLILLEVRILPAACEMREACVSLPSHLHFLV